MIVSPVIGGLAACVLAGLIGGCGQQTLTADDSTTEPAVSQFCERASALVADTDSTESESDQDSDESDDQWQEGLRAIEAAAPAEVVEQWTIITAFAEQVMSGDGYGDDEDDPTGERLAAFVRAEEALHAECGIALVSVVSMVPPSPYTPEHDDLMATAIPRESCPDAGPLPTPDDDEMAVEYLVIEDQCMVSRVEIVPAETTFARIASLRSDEGLAAGVVTADLLADDGEIGFL